MRINFAQANRGRRDKKQFRCIASSIAPDDFPRDIYRGALFISMSSFERSLARDCILMPQTFNCALMFAKKKNVERDTGMLFLQSCIMLNMFFYA